MQRSFKIGISLPRDDFEKVEEISRRMGGSRKNWLGAMRRVIERNLRKWLT